MANVLGILMLLVFSYFMYEKFFCLKSGNSLLQKFKNDSDDKKFGIFSAKRPYPKKPSNSSLLDI